MKDIEDKVAFITGGASGIGFGMARAFLQHGVKVVIGTSVNRISMQRLPPSIARTRITI